MPYWRLFYHIVWATKGRQPVLNDADTRLLLPSLLDLLEAVAAIYPQEDCREHHQDTQ